MPGLDRYLLASEQKVFAVRRHWAALAAAGTTLVLFWLGDIVVLWLLGGFELIRLIGLCFFFFSLCWFGWQVGDWFVERFVVTDKRVLLVSGLFTRRVAIMPLIKVTDLTFEQTLPGRLLDYGAFIIESAGLHQALSRVGFLPQPQQRYHQVTALLFGTDADIDPEDLPSGRPTQPVPYIPGGEPRP